MKAPVSVRPTPLTRLVSCHLLAGCPKFSDGQDISGTSTPLEIAYRATFLENFTALGCAKVLG